MIQSSGQGLQFKGLGFKGFADIQRRLNQAHFGTIKIDSGRSFNRDGIGGVSGEAMTFSALNLGSCSTLGTLRVAMLPP